MCQDPRIYSVDLIIVSVKKKKKKEYRKKEKEKIFCCNLSFFLFINFFLSYIHLSLSKPSSFVYFITTAAAAAREKRCLLLCLQLQRNDFLN